jgi:uncharacterized protein (TIGR04255 family)
MALDKHIPALQERLQAAFPRFQPPRSNRAEDVLPPQDMRVVNYEFASADNRHGVILNRETLVFHATAYNTYQDFGGRLADVLQAVGAELQHLFVRRIGLRYIDILVPAEGESLDDYVSAGLRCLPDLSLPFRRRSGLAISEFEMAEGALTVRYATGSGQLGLPPDLQPLSLTQPAVMQRPVPENRMSGLLDFDRSLPQETPFKPNQIKHRFDELRADLSLAFRELTTEYAKQVWQQEMSS